MHLSKSAIDDFRSAILSYYGQHKRKMPWRETSDAYEIMVSEIMLQQTQVQRVEGKYIEFLDKFPSINDLANTTLEEVLNVWSGLGYNRRAKFLKQSAEIIRDKFHSQIPETIEELESLPGIGHATASAIFTYSYNKPTAYIETNIRTVFIHFFFPDVENVSDKEILPLVEQTIDITNPREWYWALMDYGTYLKLTYGNLNKKSSSYSKQSKFDGSRRQKRGQIIRHLLKHKSSSIKDISKEYKYSNQETDSIVDDLASENIVIKDNNIIYIAQ